MYDALIIGAGPAGISAAIYLARAKKKVLVIYKDVGALKTAEKIENYYGFDEPISGAELFERGLLQAKRLGAQILKDEVLSIGFDESFFAKTKEGKFSSKKLIIACGASRNKPNIKGISDFSGKGVSYCAVCDAFFYRGKTVCVIGNGEYAKSEADELLNVTENVFILTDGKTILGKTDERIKIIEDKISELKGEQKLSRVVFENGEELEVDGAFIAIGVAGSDALSKKLGILSKDGHILTDEEKKTNIDGVYAIGDCTGGLLQIAKAVSDGAVCASAVIKSLKK